MNDSPGSALEHALRQALADTADLPRARSAIDLLAAMVDPGRPLDVQHEIKLLWHAENLAHVLQGRPFDARPVTMELDATLDCNYACPFCTYGDWEKSTAENAGHRFMAREDMEAHPPADGRRGRQGSDLHRRRRALAQSSHP